MPAHVYANKSVVAADDAAGSRANGDAGSRGIKFGARIRRSGSIQSIPGTSANVADTERFAADDGAEYYAASGRRISNADVRSMAASATAAAAAAATTGRSN